jgi:hypothetical protein
MRQDGEGRVMGEARRRARDEKVVLVSETFDPRDLSDESGRAAALTVAKRLQSGPPPLCAAHNRLVAFESCPTNQRAVCREEVSASSNSCCGRTDRLIPARGACRALVSDKLSSQPAPVARHWG